MQPDSTMLSRDLAATLEPPQPFDIQPQAVLFDLDDTLCDDASAWITCSQNAALAIAAELERSGGRLRLGDPEQLADIFLGISESYWFSLEAVEETRPLFEVRASQWRQALNESGEEARMTEFGADDAGLQSIAERLARDYGARRSKEIALFPDVEPTLRALREQGICLVLITNGFAATHVEKVAQLGLEALFDHVIIAGVFGHFKPDRIIFEHALQLCGCDAAHALMVGDSLVNDVGGAQAAGLAAVWFNPMGALHSAGDPKPVAGELRSIGELLPLLKIAARTFSPA